MKRIFAVIILFVIGVAFGLVLSHGPLNAQSDSDVMSKLNDIAKSQGEVLAAIASMKEDLQIIKVRVTQLQ